MVADSGAAGFVLPSEVEDLLLAGATERGTGNALANLITGNGLGNTIQAGAGDDTLLGCGGNDVLHGEGGADLFVFDAAMGLDRIADFLPGTDRLLLRGLGVADFAQLLAVALDGSEGVLIDFGGGQRLLLEGTSASDLRAEDVLFWSKTRMRGYTRVFLTVSTPRAIAGYRPGSRRSTRPRPSSVRM